MSECPCQSGSTFEVCCAPFLSKEAAPDTAEQLMRSRYTAYVKADIDYVDATHHPDHGHDFDKDEALKWAKESDWQGLEVVKTEKGQDQDSSGLVEFKAKYKTGGKDAIHHEIAEFKKVDGKWLYTEGTIVGVAPIERSAPKVGRNEPCPCGSGKKYKKCCL